MTFYLSFCEDNEFKGVILVEANSFLEAVEETCKHKINPGGEVLGINLIDEMIPDEYKESVKNCPRLQLLNKKELRKYFGSKLINLNGEPR